MESLHEESFTLLRHSLQISLVYQIVIVVLFLLLFSWEEKTNSTFPAIGLPAAAVRLQNRSPTTGQIFEAAAGQIFEAEGSTVTYDVSHLQSK